MKIKFTQTGGIATWVLWVVFIIYTSAWVHFSYNQYLNYNKPGPVVSIYTVKGLIDFVMTLPDGALKSNLLVVLAAEYGGTAHELNQILTEYSRLAIIELQKQANQLD
jgi:hypothetical protein